MYPHILGNTSLLIKHFKYLLIIRHSSQRDWAYRFIFCVLKEGAYFIRRGLNREIELYLQEPLKVTPPLVYSSQYLLFCLISLIFVVPVYIIVPACNKFYHNLYFKVVCRENVSIIGL